jgi:AcrR family transcriptional regulator
MAKQETRERILKAAMTLFAEDGYDQITTKQIAERAGVSEITLFRHFKKKRYLLEHAIDRHVFAPDFDVLFEQELVGDLIVDLKKIAHYYQKILSQNRKVILMELRGREGEEPWTSPLFKFPVQLKGGLTTYLEGHRGLLNPIWTPELIATQFIASNFGLFMGSAVIVELLDEAELSVVVDHFVDLFCVGILKPKEPLE